MTNFITTNSKIRFTPTTPNFDDININDIVAHALSFMCRANGHFRSFYSVGQHSVNCALEAKARGYSEKIQLACLLHDGSEAYLADVTRPVKACLPTYFEFEDKLQNMIWNKYLESPLTKDEYELVFEIENKLKGKELADVKYLLTKESISHPLFDKNVRLKNTFFDKFGDKYATVKDFYNNYKDDIVFVDLNDVL